MMSSQDVFSNICGTDPPIEDQYLVLSQDRVECPLLGGGSGVVHKEHSSSTQGCAI